MSSSTPHSVAQFTPVRDHWWHGDYLDLMARRLDLGACRNVLELGAGKGHWTECILPRCAEGARLTAIDRERRWVSFLQRRYQTHPNVAVVQADVTDLKALKLPGKYDLITCQTLLMHLADVPPVLHECYDLLAPGGLLLISEPNNFSNRLAISSVAADLSPAEMGQLAALWWAFERGREALGLGQEWIAVRLPAMIVAAGFSSVSVYCNDRSHVLAPPYRSDEQRAAITDWLAQPLTQDDAVAYEDTRYHALAGGLDEASFEAAWRIFCALDKKGREALEQRKYLACSSANLHLFAARKAKRL